MYCQRCKTEIPKGAAFCANCGLRVQDGSSPPVCISCGRRLSGDPVFCPYCGVALQKPGEDALNTPAGAPAPPGGSGAQGAPVDRGTALAGWSPRSSHPEILKAARDKRKFSLKFGLFMTLLFPVVFLLAGLFVSDMPMNEAIIIGGGLGFIAFIITLFSLRGGRRPPWEGTVIEKYYQDRRERSGEDSSTTYTEFITLIQADGGKKSRIVERTRRMYDYLVVGDRVRYYPVFGTYEKYDKSGDRLIYCNVCRMMNPIGNDRCKRCDNLLFK